MKRRFLTEVLETLRARGRDTLSIEEAAEISGFAHYTLRKYCRENEFGASKPNGCTGGWEIDAASFGAFLSRRRLNGANDFMKNQIKRGMRK